MMSYSRFTKRGNMYIYMSVEGLMVHTLGGSEPIQFKDNDPISEQNAIAMFRGLRDYLKANGYEPDKID